MPELLRGIAAGAVALLLLAACGGSPRDGQLAGQDTTLASSGGVSDDVPPDATGGPATETAAPPPQEIGGPEKPAPPPPAKPSVNVPRVPIGGNADTEAGCVRALSFLGADDIPKGVRIVLGDFTIDPPLFRLGGDGCGDEEPSCQGFTFRSKADRRSLSIELIGGEVGDRAQLTVTGTVECQVGQDALCASFAGTVASDRQSIDLDVPFVETTKPTDTSTEPTGNSTDTSTSGTGG